MNAIDSRFLDEFKKLEKICNEIYDCQNGVSAYIDEMENINGALYVSNWNNDYKLLKHFRWVRNQIAHDADGNVFAEVKDVDDLRNFYNRITEERDPLTLYRKASEGKSYSYAKGSAVSNKSSFNEYSYEKTNSNPITEYGYEKTRRNSITGYGFKKTKKKKSKGVPKFILGLLIIVVVAIAAYAVISLLDSCNLNFALSIK